MMPSLNRLRSRPSGRGVPHRGAQRVEAALIGSISGLGPGEHRLEHQEQQRQQDRQPRRPGAAARRPAGRSRCLVAGPEAQALRMRSASRCGGADLAGWSARARCGGGAGGASPAAAVDRGQQHVDPAAARGDGGDNRHAEFRRQALDIDLEAPGARRCRSCSAPGSAAGRAPSAPGPGAAPGADWWRRRRRPRRPGGARRPAGRARRRG